MVVKVASRATCKDLPSPWTCRLPAETENKSKHYSMKAWSCPLLGSSFRCLRERIRAGIKQSQAPGYMARRSQIKTMVRQASARQFELPVQTPWPTSWSTMWAPKMIIIKSNNNSPISTSWPSKFRPMGRRRCKTIRSTDLKEISRVLKMLNSS